MFLDKLKGKRNLRLSVFAHTQFNDKAIKIYYTMNRKSVFSPTVIRLDKKNLRNLTAYFVRRFKCEREVIQLSVRRFEYLGSV